MPAMPISSEAPNGQETGKRLAVVVGVNKTNSTYLPELDYALNDAKAMAEVLEQRCGFKLFTQALLAGQATSETVKDAVLKLARNRNEHDFILFYFSGHGQQAYDKQRTNIRNAYLGTANFNEDDVEDDPSFHISMRWLHEHLFVGPTGRVLIILDCCYAQNAMTVPDQRGEALRQQIMRYFEIPEPEEDKPQPAWYGLLAAAGYNAPAYEQDGHGIMTDLLLKALYGKEPASALLGDKGQITPTRLINYIQEKMPTGRKPAYFSGGIEGEQCILVSYPELVLSHEPFQPLVPQQRFYVPRPPDTMFQPRPGEFEHLETLLIQPASIQQPIRVGLVGVGVTGMGGIGKTQLAVEFAYHYQERFPAGVYWMTAKGSTLFEWRSELAKLAAEIRYLPKDDDISSPENEANRARHFCRYLATHPDALLILDDVEQPELVLSVLPQLAGSNVRCALLYTSRIHSAPRQIKLHDVKRLLEPAALRLLLEERRPAVWADFEAGHESVEVQAAQSICRHVGYLPLALVHLSGQLEDEQATLTRLAEVLSAGKLMGWKEILFETFHLSWKRVRDEDCSRLFKLACYFPTTTLIPMWLLGLATGLGEDAQSFTPLRDACLYLQRISLFEELVGKQVRLHSLVREFGQHLITQEVDQGGTLTRTAIEQLTNTFSNLNALEQRTQREGYWRCMEQVRAAYDYAVLLHTNWGSQAIQAEQTAPISVLERIERWLGRESYLLAYETKTPSGFFYQQLFNRAIEAEQHVVVDVAPTRWLEQLRPVGAGDQALLRVFKGHSASVTSVAFSPDGSQLLTGSYDNTARLWETRTGKLLTSYEGHHDSVNSVAFSPDGMQVLTGSDDATARLWETSTGKLLTSYEGHHDSVNSVAFSPDGMQVLTGSDDASARLWKTSSGELLTSFEGHTDIVYSVAFSPDGSQLLTASADTSARLWKTSSGELLTSFEGHTDIVYSVAFSPDGTQVLTGSDDATARLWETDSGKLLMTFAGHTNRVKSVAFSPNGSQALTGSYDETVRLWETSTGKLLTSFTGHKDAVCGVAFSPDSSQILTGSSDNTARLWETSSRNPPTSFVGHSDSISSVAFSPDGSQLLTGSSDETARLWEISTGELLATFEGHSDSVSSVAFSPDSSRILTGSYDKTIRLWELHRSELPTIFEGYRREVKSVSFSPDGSHILTGSADTTAGWWETSTGRLLTTFKGHDGEVNSVAFSPDGSQALTGSADTTACLWESSTGKRLRTFEGHSASVRSIAFSPDGAYILTGSIDTTAALWESSTGKRLTTFGGHSEAVNSVAFSPDGEIITTCDKEGLVFFWRAQEPERGELLGMYVAVYEVGAVYWQDAEHVVLADKGGASGRPHFYYLRMHGMRE